MALKNILTVNSNPIPFIMFLVLNCLIVSNTMFVTNTAKIITIKGFIFTTYHLMFNLLRL